MSLDVVNADVIRERHSVDEEVFQNRTATSSPEHAARALLTLVHAVRLHHILEMFPVLDFSIRVVKSSIRRL